MDLDDRQRRRRPKRSGFLRASTAREADADTREAIVRGVDYLLESQLPNGCFPQVYPLQGSYHDAVTFNDDATVNALRVLRTSPMAGTRVARSIQRTRALRAERGRASACESQVVRRRDDDRLGTAA